MTAATADSAWADAPASFSTESLRLSVPARAFLEQLLARPRTQASEATGGDPTGN